MPSGGIKSRKHKQNWIRQKREDGYKQVNWWVPPELIAPLLTIAEKEMIPFSTAVELVLRGVLLDK